MDFIADTTHLDYNPTSPAWLAVPSDFATKLRSEMSNSAAAIRHQQDRLRSLLPQHSSLKRDGATADELAAKEAELKETSGELSKCVSRFEAFLAQWEEEVVDKGDKRKRSPSEEVEEYDDSFSPSPPPTIPLPIVRQRYQNVRNIDPNIINVGDIGWAPLPRMALSNTAANVPSEFGDICIKSYPFIIAKKMQDCMIGVVITSAGGWGLANKSASLRARSTYVTGDKFRGYRLPSYGWAVGPPGLNLEVDLTDGEYDPAEGAFVDVLDSYQIPYNTRFERDGRLTGKSRVDLGLMRCAALLADAVEA